MPDNRNNPNTTPGNGTSCEGPRSLGRCSPVHQRGPGHHHVSATKKRLKKVNIMAMESYCKSNPINENGIGKEYTGNG